MSSIQQAKLSLCSLQMSLADLSDLLGYTKSTHTQLFIYLQKHFLGHNLDVDTIGHGK